MPRRPDSDSALREILRDVANTRRFADEADAILKELEDSSKSEKKDNWLGRLKATLDALKRDVLETSRFFYETYSEKFLDENFKELPNGIGNHDGSDGKATVKEESKSWVRCVDISKLIENNIKNSSVITISDSESSRTDINAISPKKSVLKTTPCRKRQKKSVSFRDPETSDIDDLSSSTPKPTRKPSERLQLPRKSRPTELHDVSSLSSDDSSDDDSSSEEVARGSRRTAPRRPGPARRRPGSPRPRPPSPSSDEKLARPCYVRLAKVHPDVMRRNYEKLLLKNEVERLTNMHSLKRRRKPHNDSPSSGSSSELDKKTKKPRKDSTTKKTIKNKELSSSSSAESEKETNDSLPLLPVCPEPPVPQPDELEAEIENAENQLEALGADSGGESSTGEGPHVEEGEEKSKKDEETVSIGKNSKETIDEGLNEGENSKGDNTEVDAEVKKQKSEKSKWRRDKLLTEKLGSSSESEEGGHKKKQKKANDKETQKKNVSDENKELEPSKESNIDKSVDNLDEQNESNGNDISAKTIVNENKDTNEEDKINEKSEINNKDSSSDPDSDIDSKTKSSSNDKEKKQNDTDSDVASKKKSSKNEKDKKQDSDSDADVVSKKKSSLNDNEKEEDSTDSDAASAKKSSTNEKNKKQQHSDSDSDVISKKKSSSKKKKKDQTSGSESEETFAKFMDKSEKLYKKRFLKKKRRVIVNSDSESDSHTKKASESSDEKSSKSSSSEKESDKEEEPKKPSKKRSRIKKVKDSSDEDGDKSTRKQIRKVWTKDSLAESTIAAEKEEAARKARILEKQKKYNQIFELDSLEKSTVDKVVLDFDEDKEILVVHEDIAKHLKPHQAKGIQFMWDTCFESVERAKKDKGSGCILAHCMGLGKTLQVVTLVHTLISNCKKTKIEKVLVVCPLSTVLNWVAEFKKWLPDDEAVNVFDIVAFKQNIERLYQIKEWERCGGALILGYDMFRNLTNTAGKRMSKKLREGFQRCLVDPGPDMVICDEGHLLKNEKTSLSIAMNKIKTPRRIVLTGTPLQNNLKEYWCMVQFVKPNLLGTYKEYLNRFVNPIVNGQYTDSTQHDIQLMRKRSHVLHKLLDGVVQRRDYGVLAPFLPPKYEYVLFVTLTDKQIQLYEYYLREKARRPQEGGSGRSSFLFVDFQELQRICTHARVLLDKSIENKIARDKKELDDDESEGSLKDFIDDDSEKSDTPSGTSNSSGSESGSDSNSSVKKKAVGRGRRVTRATRAQGVVSESEEEEQTNEPDPLEWWREFITDEDLDDILISGKLTLLFEILRHCEGIGDKVLVFSQSLYSLNVIEYFLSKVDDATQNSESGSFCGFSGSWSLGLDYFRLDGSSSADNRAAWCKTFNNVDNVRARLFLISTRAGGLGINLVAANRVIIFDVSWNPSHDTQSIYRVYRFGQTKPSYIYRFVTLGTMEMKIYERQVIKQAISKRVIDEQQIDRHYNQNDLAELYKFEPKPEGDRPIPLVPTDILLGELLQQDHKIYKYHLHQSLLENKEDEVLDEEERKAAWEEFENEKKMRQFSGSINHIPIHSIMKAIASIIAREQPALTPLAVQTLVPQMLEEMQEQMAAGDNTMYNKVLNEIRFLQATVQQQKIEEYYRMQQQQQNLFLQQYQQQLMSNPTAAAQFIRQLSSGQQMNLGNMNMGNMNMNNMNMGNMNNMNLGNMNMGNQNYRMPHNSRRIGGLNAAGGLPRLPMQTPQPQALQQQQQQPQKSNSSEVIELN